MTELLSQLWTPELQVLFIVLVVMLVALYVLSIVWVVRDAMLRGVAWYVWGIVALIPIVGVIAYCLMRPSLLAIDKEEQELEVALKRRELARYGECAHCGYPVEADYIMCPNCHQRLKNLCRTCHHALDPAWDVCPFCATSVGVRRGPQTGRVPQGNPQAGVAQAAAAQARAAQAAPVRTRVAQGGVAQGPQDRTRQL